MFTVCSCECVCRGFFRVRRSKVSIWCIFGPLHFFSRLTFDQDSPSFGLTWSAKDNKPCCVFSIKEPLKRAWRVWTPSRCSEMNDDSLFGKINLVWIYRCVLWLKWGIDAHVEAILPNFMVTIPPSAMTKTWIIYIVALIICWVYAVQISSQLDKMCGMGSSFKRPLEMAKMIQKWRFKLKWLTYLESWFLRLFSGSSSYRYAYKMLCCWVKVALGGEFTKQTKQ